MSFPKPPVVASSIALLAALSLVPTQGWARDGRSGGDVIYEIPPLQADSSIIFEMAPMRPVPGAATRAQAHKPAPKPAQPAEPAIAAKPAPAPVHQAAPAQPPAPIDQAAPAQPAVAEAAKPVEPQPAVAEAPAQPVAQPPEAPAAPQSAAAESAPAQAATEMPPPPVDAQGAPLPPVPVEQTVAGEAAIVEPAPFEAPIMTFNPPRKAIAAVKAPVAALGEHVIELQGGSTAPSLVPRLRSLAPDAPAPVAAQPGPQPSLEAQPQPAADAAAAQADADARISALLGQGLVGPVEVRIGDRATMWLPKGRVFLPLETARKLAQEAGLEWRPGVQGMVAPAGGKLEWLAPVELVDDGHVETGAPETLQPEKLLAAFQASLPEVNAQRARAGQPPVALDGWLTPPALNDKRHLSGCVNISTQNDQNGLDKFFNCESWALGRLGAIKIGLADGAEGAAHLKDEAAALADTIIFDRGKAYEDFDAAVDKVAAYAAGDLLTRDVTAKAPAPAAAAEEGQGAGLSGLISSLLYPALFGVAALGLYVFIKRRRDAAMDEGEEAEAAPARKRVERETEPRRGRESPIEATAASVPEASPSLFARLLPTLYARFAKNADSDVETRAEEEAPLRDAKGVASNVDAGDSVRGGLMGKIAAMRASKGDAAKPAPTAFGGAPVNDADEPASALKKLAAKMRRNGADPTPGPEAVNLSRVMRPSRVLGGAAPALIDEPVVEPLVVETPAAQEPEPVISLVEPIAPAPVVAPEPRTSAPVLQLDEAEDGGAHDAPAIPSAAAPQSVFDEDDFSLVEPGDSHAASNAVEASLGRRASDR